MRIATKMGWTGKVFYISRDFWMIGTTQYREALETPGIYILAGNGDDDDDDLQTIYIGQTGNLLTRVGEHLADSKKLFFQSVVCVTGGDDFNSAHFRWMEAHLTDKAKKIDRCVLKAGQIPKKPHVAVAQVFAIEHFLQEALQIFPVVEIKAFVAPKTIVSGVDVNQGIEREKNNERKSREINTERISEIKTKVIAAFQKRKNVTLLKRSQATFYDESKTFHVCCAVSKNYPNKKQNSYWFAPGKKWLDFLASGSKSYLIFCMGKKHQAVVLSFDEFDNIKDKLGMTTKKEDDYWWHVIIDEENGNFTFRLKGGETLDASPYLFVID